MLQPEPNMPQPVDELVQRANEMTVRARWYLAIAAARHLLTGGFALLLPMLFTSSAFVPIVRVAPLRAWAILFLVAGTACLFGAVLRSEPLARLGMALSATSTLLIGMGLLIAFVDGITSGRPIGSPAGAILFLAVAAKDYVVCAQPIRSPFEGLAAQIVRKSSTQ